VRIGKAVLNGRSNNIKKKFIQYQANHDAAPEDGGFLRLFRIALLLAIVVLLIWLWA